MPSMNPATQELGKCSLQGSAALPPRLRAGQGKEGKLRTYSFRTSTLQPFFYSDGVASLSTFLRWSVLGPPKSFCGSLCRLPPFSFLCQMHLSCLGPLVCSPPDGILSFSCSEEAYCSCPQSQPKSQFPVVSRKSPPVRL